MHKAFKVGPESDMEDAANIVVQKGAHRICVCDTDGALLGVVSRGDIMRATIANFQAYMDRQAQKKEQEA
jgi:CBS domain-containing protein